MLCQHDGRIMPWRPAHLDADRFPYGRGSVRCGTGLQPVTALSRPDDITLTRPVNSHGRIADAVCYAKPAFNSASG